MTEREMRGKGRQVRLVISDMDGTLLDSQKRIGERTLKALRRLRDRQVAFTICTGRIPTMVEHYIKEMDIQNLVVAANGAVIWDPIKSEPVYQRSIPPEAAQELMDFCRFHQMDYSALTLDACYFSPNSQRIRRFRQYNQIAREKGGRQIRLEYLGANHGFLMEKRIDKMLIYQLEPGQSKKAEDFLKDMPQMACTSSDAGLWDVSAAGASKGAGLKMVAQSLGLDLAQVMAFGDYHNDISMFQASGLAVAMGNGCPEAKEAAAWVAPPNDQEGVAQVLEKVMLDEKKPF